MFDLGTCVTCSQGPDRAGIDGDNMTWTHTAPGSFSSHKNARVSVLPEDDDCTSGQRLRARPAAYQPTRGSKGQISSARRQGKKEQYSYGGLIPKGRQGVVCIYRCCTTTPSSPPCTPGLDKHLSVDYLKHTAVPKLLRPRSAHREHKSQRNGNEQAPSKNVAGSDYWVRMM